MATIDTINKSILTAIDTLISQQLSSLSFNRTVAGKIIRKTEKGYLVGLEGTQVDVALNGDDIYKNGDTVNVEIPQNNLSNAYINSPQIAVESTVDLSPINKKITSVQDDIYNLKNGMLLRPIVRLVKQLPEDAASHPDILYLIEESEES